MRKFEKETTKVTYELSEVICNKCGKSADVIYGDHGYPIDNSYEYWVEFSQKFGFYSSFDCQEISFDLCEPCFKNLIESFIHPAKIEEYSI